MVFHVTGPTASSAQVNRRPDRGTREEPAAAARLIQSSTPVRPGGRSRCAARRTSKSSASQAIASTATTQRTTGSDEHRSRSHLETAPPTWSIRRSGRRPARRWPAPHYRSTRPRSGLYESARWRPSLEARHEALGLSPGLSTPDSTSSPAVASSSPAGRRRSPRPSRDIGGQPAALLAASGALYRHSMTARSHYPSTAAHMGRALQAVPHLFRATAAESSRSCRASGRAGTRARRAAICTSAIRTSRPSSARRASQRRNAVGSVTHAKRSACPRVAFRRGSDARGADGLPCSPCQSVTLLLTRSSGTEAQVGLSQALDRLIDGGYSRFHRRSHPSQHVSRSGQLRDATRRALPTLRFATRLRADPPFQ